MRTRRSPTSGAVPAWSTAEFRPTVKPASSAIVPGAFARDRTSGLTRIRAIDIAGALLAAALVAWIIVLERMRGMDAGPGTDLGAFGWYVGIWVTMMAAMMLPSVAPMVLVFARISRERAARGREVVPTWLFLAGYLATWTAYGVPAYGVYRGSTASTWASCTGIEAVRTSQAQPSRPPGSTS